MHASGGKVGLDIRPGPKLASGRDADVFDLGNGRVLRRYRESGKSAELEARVMRFVREQGYPVPAVYEVSGPDMVLDHVNGPTMLDDLGRRPWMLQRHARTLAKLHRQLHGIPAPDWVPTYASHPAFVANVDPKVLAQTSNVVATPPAPDALLHLDLHPANVILSSSGPVVIDWRNTRRGDDAIDVATTWLIMATSDIAGSGLDRFAGHLVRRLFVEAFMRQMDRSAAARRLLLVGHYRLSDPNLLPTERPTILDFVRRSGASP